VTDLSDPGCNWNNTGAINFYEAVADPYSGPCAECPDLKRTLFVLFEILKPLFCKDFRHDSRTGFERVNR
jgi:hypothetical protein